MDEAQVGIAARPVVPTGCPLRRLRSAGGGMLPAR